MTRAEIAEQIGVGIGVDVTFEQCSRAEAEAALQAIMGSNAAWYLDVMASGVDEPQQANQLVAELTGCPPNRWRNGRPRTPRCSVRR